MGTWALGKLGTQVTQGTRKALGHSDTKGTWALGHLWWHSGTRALGRLGTLNTSALGHWRHSITQKVFGHLDTWALEALYLVDSNSRIVDIFA